MAWTNLGRSWTPAATALVLFLGAPASAGADAAAQVAPADSDPTEPSVNPPPEPAEVHELDGDAAGADAKDHRGQVLFNVQIGTGYRGIAPYDEEYCGELDDDGSDAPICVGRLPARLGLQLGYGVSAGFEVLFELGIGLESAFGTRAEPDDGPRPLYIAPGIRGYFAEIGPTQIFSSLQLVADFTDFTQADGADIQVRNLNGVQFDVHRTFGILVYVGEAVGFKRWLSFALEAGVGVQARFP